jgi:hypothetical protein
MEVKFLSCVLDLKAGARQSTCSGERYMSIKELETAALRLLPEDRARLAKKLLESLENLSDEENVKMWAEDGEGQDVPWSF